MVSQGVGIASQFLVNARVNGVQSGQSVDRLARRSLLGSYIAGHTRVTATLGSPAATIAVDDIRGFQFVPLNGVLVAVADATGKRMTVDVNGTSYTLIGATAADPNTSSLASTGGISGTLTFTGNVSTTNGTTNNYVRGYYAPTILRPNARTTTKKLVGTDLFTMGLALDAVTQLRNNAVPTVDGLYNCYLDNTSARQLFADADFKLLYQGNSAAEEFRRGRVIELLDLRFMPTTEAVQQAITNEASAAINVHRPIVCGAGALVEGVFADTAYADVPTPNSIMFVQDGIAQVIRPPIDRLGQIIAQSWYYIGGFVCPTDVTADTTIIPTASNALHKRAVLIEHA